MKRGKKLLLLLAILVIAAGAALAAVRLFSEGEAVETAEEPETVILSLSSDDISSIGWTFEEETVTFNKTDGGWEYADDPAFPLNETGLSGVLGGVSSVLSAKTIEAPEDVSQYGLDIPACVVTIETEAGIITELQIGNETDMGGERYVSVGDGNVYLTDASVLDAFSIGLYDLVQTEAVPNMSDVNAMEVDAETQTLVVEHLPDSGLAYSDAYEWFSPDGDDYIALDTELAEDLVESVTLMSWIDCVDYAADESELQTYGLDKPAATVTVLYTEEAQVATNLTDDSGNVIYDTETRDEVFGLELGAYVDSYCYARLTGSNMVYIVDAAILDGLLYTNTASLRPDEVLAADWSEAVAIDVTLDGIAYHLEKGEVSTAAETEEAAGNEEDAYDDAEITYETAWLMNGNTVAIEDALTELTSLTAAAYADGETPERSEELSIVIHQQNEAYPELELVIYQYDSSVCLAVLNGDTVTYVDRAAAVAVTDALREALAPEPAAEEPEEEAAE